MSSIPAVALAIGGGAIVVGAVVLVAKLFEDNVEEEIKILYHYTDSQGAAGIKRNGRIRESTDPRDTLLGEGVYFTDLPPSTPDKDLLQNNYDDGSSLQAKNHEKVAYYVKLRVPGHKIKRFVKLKDSSGRQVYRHKGEIVLSEYNGKVDSR